MKKSNGQTEKQKKADCIAELVRRIESMTRGMCGPDVSPKGWVKQWLKLPHPALGGRPPEDFLKDDQGRQIVINLLAQMEAGAYA